MWRKAIKLAAEDLWEPDGRKGNLRNSRENCNKENMRGRKICHFNKAVRS